MQLGGFGKIEDYLKIQEAGFDFAELDMPEIEELGSEAFGTLCKCVKEYGFPILSGARILPVKEPLFFKEGFRPESLKDYLKKSCSRCEKLGIRKVILGNGKARWMRKESDWEREQVFVELLDMMAEVAAENGQELILEPLGPKYSNYINTIPEAVEVIRRTGNSNLFTMADLRHMVWSQEAFTDLVQYRKYIHHIHIDYPLSYPERGFPDAEDDFDYAEFLKALELSGYNDTLVIEADVPRDWKAAYKQAMNVLGTIK